MSWFFIMPFSLVLFISSTDVHINNSFCDNPARSCIIHEMYDYDGSKLNLFDYWLHQWHIHLKEKKSILLVYRFKIFFTRKYNPLVPPMLLICLYGGWWLRIIVFKDKLGYEVQYATLLSFEILWVSCLFLLRSREKYWLPSNAWNSLKVSLPHTFLIHCSSMPKHPSKSDYSREKPQIIG